MKGASKMKGGIISDLMNDVRFVVFIVGTAISVFTYLTNPAHKQEKDLASLASELTKHEEVQVGELRALTTALANIKDNDLHTIEGKTEQNRQSIEALTNAVVELKTIIDERIPKKR